MKPIQMLLDLLFPPRCAFCGKLLWAGDGDDSRACHKCISLLPRPGDGQGVTTGNYFVRCVSPFYYQDSVRKAVLRLKFGRAEALAVPFGHYVADCLRESPEVRYDMISWVPLSRKRLSERGYDQAEAIARQAARDLGAPFGRVLVKQKNTAAQSGMKGPEARKTNIKDAYRVYDKADIAGKTILLIDDVVTTGSTLSECAKTLLLGGADLVYAATFAKTPDNRREHPASQG